MTPRFCSTDFVCETFSSNLLDLKSCQYNLASAAQFCADYWVSRSDTSGKQRSYNNPQVQMSDIIVQAVRRARLTICFANSRESNACVPLNYFTAHLRRTLRHSGHTPIHNAAPLLRQPAKITAISEGPALQVTAQIRRNRV